MVRRSRGVRRRYAARQKGTPPANQSNSRLLPLPAEVRNRIWTACFGGTHHHLLIERDIGARTARQIYTKAPPILKTCKQIYIEAVGIYYSTTIFAGAIFDANEDLQSLIQWLTHIGCNHAGLINNVFFRLCRTVDDIELSSDPSGQEFDLLEDQRDSLRPIQELINNWFETNGISPVLIRTNIWLAWQRQNFMIWTADPVATYDQARKACRKGDDSLERWLDTVEPHIERL